MPRILPARLKLLLLISVPTNFQSKTDFPIKGNTKLAPVPMSSPSKVVMSGLDSNAGILGSYSFIQHRYLSLTGRRGIRYLLLQGNSQVMPKK